MAAKGPRTLFEAMQSSSRRAPRESMRPPAGQEPAGLADNVARKRRGPRFAPLVSRVTPRTVAVLVLAVGAALVIAWWARGRGGDAGGGDKVSQSIEQVTAGPIAGDVLANSGLAGTGSAMTVGYGETAVPDPGSGAAATLPEAGGSRDESVPGAGVDASVSGNVWIRILRTQASRKSDYDRAVAFLKARGIETQTVLRSRYYFLYTRQTFPSPQHAMCQSLLKRIKQVGVEFAEESNTSTDFHDAYAIQKVSRN